jgi:hypothetical protein
VLAFIGVVVVVMMVGNRVQQVMKNAPPVTAQSARQEIGTDVPLYPGATFDQSMTQSSKVGVEVTKGILGDKIAATAPRMAVYSTSDSADAVYAYYDKELPKKGWTPVNAGSAGLSRQSMYRKGNDMLIVQCQGPGGTTLIQLIRMRAPEGAAPRGGK